MSGFSKRNIYILQLVTLFDTQAKITFEEKIEICLHGKIF